MTSLNSSSTTKSLFVLSTTTSAICSGVLLSISYLHVPAYLMNTSRETLLTQWQTMGALGKAVIPPLTLLASGANFANAYMSPLQSQRYRFVVAGALSLSILPYTAVALASTNAELGAREATNGKSSNIWLSNLSLKELIQRWSSRSAVRGYLLLASAIVSYDAGLGLTF